MWSFETGVDGEGMGKRYLHVMENDMNKIIELIDVEKKFKSGEGIIRAVNKVSLEIEEGSFVALVGKSGSGKSTLLHLIGGIDDADNGKIIIDGVDINNLNDEDKTIFRRKTIGYIFQSFNLIPMLSVYENIIFPIQMDHKRVNNEEIDKVLEYLEIKDKKYALPAQLSGGQQQRVAIARALLMNTKVILADEPTGNLDSITGEKVIELLSNTVKKFGRTVVMITHNNEMAQKADRIIEIKDGEVAQQ